MQRKPRNSAVDKLVNARLMSFAYLQIGVMQACAGFLAYFAVFLADGWKPSDLPGADCYFDPDVECDESRVDPEKYEKIVSISIGSSVCLIT